MFLSLKRAARYFLKRSSFERDMQREVEAHLAMEIDQRVARGMSPAEARRTALVEFGGVAAAEEAIRDARGLNFWDALVQDVRFGLRLLRRQPSFSIVAILVLSLGIGANTAVFGVVNELLLKPRPGHPDGAVIGVFSRDTSQADEFRTFSYPTFAEMRAHKDVFASLSAHNFAMVGVSEGEVTRRSFIDIVTADFFDTFGAPPILGRAFTADEERPGADIPVTVLSYPVWQRMGGGRDILGRTIRLNSREFTIVGVAPRGFGGSVVFATPEVFVPTGVYDTLINDFSREGRTTNLADRAHNNLFLIARLPRGATMAHVEPALPAIDREIVAADPVGSAHQVLQLAPLARMSVSTKPTDDSQLTGITVALLTMAAVVLAVASFNLANMLLARHQSRRKEMAIRLAIGGSRGRVVRQLLTEGLVLSIIGGLGGLLLAIFAVQALVGALVPLSPINVSVDPQPDWRIFAATFGYCTLSTVLFGLLPARKLARTDTVPELKGHAGELADPRRRRFALTNTMLLGQLALSMVLLTVAGLFMRSATEAARADPGFTFERGIIANIDPSLAGFNAVDSRAIQLDALARVRARPEVAAASLASIIPFGEIRNGLHVQTPGPKLKAEEPGNIESTLTSVSAGYFDAIGKPILVGRDFTAAEESVEGGPRTAIVDVTLAEQLFGGANPVGRSLQYTPRETDTSVLVEIVGVVPALRDSLFDTTPPPHVYFPIGQEYQTGVFLHARTRAASADAEAALLPSLRQTLRDVQARLPVVSLETRPMYRDRNLMLAVVRLGAAIFIVFGAVALFLAAVGIYGVKAYVVSRRTHEIGIRLALGATPKRIVWMVLRDGLAATVVGVGIGLLLSAGAGAAMSTLTFQGRVADLGILGAALIVLAASALLAAWIPAHRATRITPLRAMKA